jgi:hypothetical protein
MKTISMSSEAAKKLLAPAVKTGKHSAREAHTFYRPSPPELRHQRRDDWLSFATVAEVRRAWRDWMGELPPWASCSGS